MQEHEFITALASKAPTPGGGGASAYCGALASALASMVVNLTVGKKTYADYEDQMQAASIRLAGLRQELLELVDEDARAFAPLAAAYKMPKTTEEELALKNEALQTALRAAADAPLKIMETCAKVIEECELLAYHGSRMALSDVGVALLFAKAALLGASLNVIINAKSFNDKQVGQYYLDRIAQIQEPACTKADSLYEYVLKEL